MSLYVRVQAQGTSAEASVRQQLQDRYSPAAIKAMIELGVTASGYGRGSSSSRGSSIGNSSSSSSSSRSSSRRPAEAALIAEVPSRRK
jgi:hypothetical protein